MPALRTAPSRPRLARLAGGAVLVALAAAPARAGDLPTPNELIDASTKAMGGPAIEKIESYATIAETTAPMGTITAEVKWAKPDRVLARQTLPQMGEVVMGANGDVAWMHNQMMGGYSLLEGQQREQVHEQAIHMRLMNLRKTAKDEFEFTGVTETEFAGAACYELAFVAAGEDPEAGEGGEGEKGGGSILFDADSGLIRGMRMESAGQSSTVRLDDWKTIEGVRFFHRMELAGGPMAVTMNFTKIEVNTVDPAVFAVPDEVKELVKKQAGKTAEEMKLEDFSAQVRTMIESMMEGLPWDDPAALEKARDSIARQADRPDEFGKGMKYVLQKIDTHLEGGG